MDTYTLEYSPDAEDGSFFGRQLAYLAVHLSLNPPRFRGRELGAPGGRWEIETLIPGRTMEPVTSALIYYQIYPNWRNGVRMATEVALARMCYLYREEIPDEYQSFGWRDEEGDPLRATASRDQMPKGDLQLEDMECLMYYVEQDLRQEMHLLNEERIKTESLERAIQMFKDKMMEMEACNDKLKIKEYQLETQILALQARNAHLAHQLSQPRPEVETTPPLQEVTADLEPQDDKGKEIMEEDPEERILYDSDGGEIVPTVAAAPEPSGPKRRRTGRTRAYLRQFQSAR